MDEHYLKNVVEAALLAAGRPMNVEQLRELFEERDRPEAEAVREALAALVTDYTGRGIELREISSGFRIQVRAGVGDTVSRLWQERPARYSRALLETLALVAYRQPITRGEIEEIRGVGINQNILRTLFERNWIRVVGHRQVPGHPELLGTTREFLDYFNLKSLEQLPTLAALRDMDNVGVQLELPGDDSPADGQNNPPESPPPVAEAGGVESSAAAGDASSEPEAQDPDQNPESPGEDDDGADAEHTPEALLTRGLTARGSE